MNAKKIMGAVLVALLAAALFVGAGAADDVDIGIVTTYTQLPAVSNPSGFTWAGGMTFIAADGTPISVVDDGTNEYFAVEGSTLNKQYSGYGITFTLVAPTAVVAALDNGVNIIDKTVTQPVANGATFVYTIGTTTKTLTGTAGTSTSDFIFIDEDGVKYEVVPTFSAGKWGVAAVLTGKTGVSSISSVPLYGQVYYFTVAKTEASLSAVKDTVNVGENIVLNIQYPGQTSATISYDVDDVQVIDDQVGVTDNTGTVDVVLGMDGTASVAFQTLQKGNTKFTLTAPGNPKVTVAIVKGEITVVADEDSFFTGNAIKLSGTTTAGSKLFFYIEGTNFPLTQINSEAAGAPKYFTTNGDLEVENGEWTAAIDSAAVKYTTGQKLVAGTYTVIVSTWDFADDLYAPGTSATSPKEMIMDVTYGVAAVTLTQPFIENVKANAVAIQELEYEVTGTAYAAEGIRYYVFGTNFFIAGNADYDDEEETFEFSLPAGMTKAMDPGVYFYLIQHPMGDKLFNVWNGNVTTSFPAAADGPNNADVKASDFYYAATATPLVKNATFIFNAYERGTNFAAQALLDEIAGQNIDDWFVKGTFEVAPQKLTINPIPAEVAKGSALTVSGTSNCGEGTEVIVNVLEGQFGATVKGDENAATFLTQKAVTKADGTWEAAIDTSKLKTGTYTVTVELNGVMFDSENVKIVDAAPVTPVDPVDPVDPKPVDPVTPTEPETPGFGALAALAGLGAVAVLLLRRE